MTYDERAKALNGIGLTAVPCWIRPMYTLSNGQRARAEAAIAVARAEVGVSTCLDEWTSVVDRTVAKVMSHCVQKHARRSGRAVVLNSCHYDVIEWLNPDWIIDCNAGTYTNRRSLCRDFKRTEQLNFEVRAVGRETWKPFSRYHYLNARLAGGKVFCFGIFHGEDQIGFGAYSNYVIGDQKCFHSNRVVIHPDYAGFGLGIRFINETAKEMVRNGYRIKAKFSSLPLHKARQRDLLWRLTDVQRNMKSSFTTLASRSKAFRTKVVTYHYDFIWKQQSEEKPA